jgi:hypothetical protein
MMDHMFLSVALGGIERLFANQSHQPHHITPLFGLQ